MNWIVLTLLTASALGGESPARADDPPSMARAIEKAHAELWDHRVDKHGIILDYVGEIPTPEDCQLGKPNAIGWWSPIENGPMFTGLYLPSACERARRTGAAADKANAKRLVEGLLLCASVSDVPGFVARGVGTDGKCHYPLGSDDQTHPWFLGLHAYCTSGLPTAEERKAIVKKMQEVADVLQSTRWKCPCDGAFKGQFRGGYQGHLVRDAVRYLYLLRAMHDVTQEKVWLERYQSALSEKPKGSDKTRAELCAEGFPHDREAIARLDEHQMWIYVGCQASLVRLIALETDEKIRAHYQSGLAVNAKNAIGPLEGYTKFDNADKQAFGHANWREGYPNWVPQKTQAEAEKVAQSGDKVKLGGRKSYEARFMRNPLAAAAIVAMGGDPTKRDSVERAIRHYDYTKLNMTEFFFAEVAFYALPDRVRP
jgi:hypothetical protein